MFLKPSLQSLSYCHHEEGAVPTLVMTKLRSGSGLMGSRSRGQELADTRFGLWLLALDLRLFLSSQAIQAIVSRSRPLGGGEPCLVLRSL